MSGPLSNGNGTGASRLDQYVDWAVRLVLVAGIAFGWNVGLRLTRIETQLDATLPEALRMREFMGQGPRFTDTDAHQLEQEMKTWVEERLYPDWLRDDISQIKSRVGLLPAIEARLGVLETRVSAMEK